jgi:hypothetical protein
MEFFKTDKGELHRTRVVGVLIVVAFLTSCGLDLGAVDICAARAAFTIGWWLAFCGKRPVQEWSGTFATPLRSVGIVLVFLGVFGQFYVVWRHH